MIEADSAGRAGAVAHDGSQNGVLGASSGRRPLGVRQLGMWLVTWRRRDGLAPRFAAFVMAETREEALEVVPPSKWGAWDYVRARPVAGPVDTRYLRVEWVDVGSEGR